MIDWRTRATAALVHMAGSAVAAVAAALLVFVLWYPWPYTALAGGTGLFVLITSVDVVMGPALTFVVFDRRKGWPHLRRDLAVIVALQLVALGYGLHTMYNARPVVLALETDRFRVVSANDVLLDELGSAPASLQHLTLTGPVLIRTEPPTDPKEKFDAIGAALAGADLGARPKYWRAWDAEAARQLQAAGRPIEALRKKHPQRTEELDKFLQATGVPEDSLRFLPILSRHEDWVVLVDARSGSAVGYAPFSPF